MTTESNQLLVGFYGRAGSGKDTAADEMATQGYARYSFAQPIYAAVSAMLGVPVSTLRDREFKEAPLGELSVSPRVLMQTLGTEWAREMIREDFWVRIAAREWRRTQARARKGLIISDVRFSNEAEWIRSEGGMVIHVVRDDIQQVAGHISEAPINPDLIHYTVYNNSTIADLHIQVRNIFHPPESEGARIKRGFEEMGLDPDAFKDLWQGK
jgi:hypothetical protein